MNVLLLLGLVLFACVVVWVYFLFTTEVAPKTKKTYEVVYDDVMGRCRSLYEQGMHAELQKYAQKELSKNYSDIELRRILAESFLASGDEEKAIMHYEAILNIMPNDTLTQEFLAKYYYENGPKTRAAEIYEQMLMFDSGNFEAAETLARLYEELNYIEKAIDIHKMLLDAEVDPEAAEKLEYRIADLYNRINDLENAFFAYEKIYNNNPENIEVLMLVADYAYRLNYWREALKYFDKIITTVGEDFEILNKIAQVYVNTEDWSNAALIYEKIIENTDKNSPDYSFTKNEYSNILMKDGQIEKAIEILKELVAQNPNETAFKFSLAQALATTANFDGSMKLYSKLLDEMPADKSEIIIKYISNMICSWALDLFQKGEYSQAFDKFFEALKYDEENEEVYYQLGRCNFHIKSFQDAASHFKKAISIKPQESRFHYGLGCVYDEMVSLKEAKNEFQEAINLNPNHIPSKIAYAITLTKELKYAQSAEKFREILTLIPDDADTTYNLALACELVGDIDTAIEYYKKAISLNKNHVEARHNLSLILGEEYDEQKEDIMIE